jgi:hypothetical protein
MTAPPCSRHAPVLPRQLVVVGAVHVGNALLRPSVGHRRVPHVPTLRRNPPVSAQWSSLSSSSYRTHSLLGTGTFLNPHHSANNRKNLRRPRCSSPKLRTRTVRRPPLSTALQSSNLQRASDPRAHATMRSLATAAVWTRASRHAPRTPLTARHPPASGACSSAGPPARP